MKLPITLLAVAGAAALLSPPVNAAPAPGGQPQAAPPAFAVVQYRSLEDPDFYPTGTTPWWRAMDHESRGGAQ